MNLTTFFRWEAHSRDAVDFKKIYVDMAGDLVAGLLLSQILYWHLPDAQGQRKLQVQRDGHWWLAKRHTDWFDECRITARQVPRALKLLQAQGLIVVEVHRFRGERCTHIRLNEAGFLAAWHAALTPPPPPPPALPPSKTTQTVVSNLPVASLPTYANGSFQPTQSAVSITEITPENTPQSTTERDDALVRPSLSPALMTDAPFEPTHGLPTYDSDQAPPPSSAAPPPSPPPDEAALVAALRHACGITEPASPRKEQRLCAAAQRLGSQGYTPEQVAQTRCWFNTHLFPDGRVPHLSQIEDHITQAIAAAGTPRASPPPPLVPPADRAAALRSPDML